MKKVILVLALILVIVGAVLSALDSGGEYAAEKIFYHAAKINSKIAVNPDVAPPGMVAAVERDLISILKKYPNAKTARAAHMTLAELYLANKKYEKALAAADEILKKYPKDINLTSRAQFIKGNAYDKQGKWDKALLEYAILRDDYTNTPLGLEIPLYIGKRYVSKGMQKEADSAYRDAVLFYRKLEAKNKNNMLGYAASNLLIQAYANLGRYEEAGKEVESIISNYPLALILRQQLRNVEFIFIKVLNRPEKAIEIFDNVKNRVKDPKLREFLEKRIEVFKGKKS